MLDAGIGFGLFGHLLRQYLDVWEGRIQREDWRIRIDGIEIDERRVQPHARYLYNEVFVGDIRDLVSHVRHVHRMMSLCLATCSSTFQRATRDC